MSKVSLCDRDRLGGLEVKLPLDRGRREALVVQYMHPVISVSGNPASVKLFLELDPLKVASIHWKNKDYFVRICLAETFAYSMISIA